MLLQWVTVLFSATRKQQFFVGYLFEVFGNVINCLGVKQTHERPITCK